MRRTSMFAAFLLIALPAWADIDVTIVDHPAGVPVYGPIVVTAKVVNEGKEALLVPASPYSESRYAFYSGTTPKSLSRHHPLLNSDGGSVTWLEPGDSWFFQVDLGQYWDYEVGTLYVAAEIHSTGRCQYSPRGTETFPLKVVDGSGSRSVWYECWSGSTMSDVVSIDVLALCANIRETLSSLRLV